MSTATTATSPAATHLLNPNQQDSKTDEFPTTHDSISVVDSPGKPDPELALNQQTDSKKDDAGTEVKVLRQIIQSPGREDIIRTTPFGASSAKSPLLVIKEGCLQQARFEYVVSRNVVSGLKYIREVWKKGIKVNSYKEMVGTFGPREEPYKFELEEAMIPCGFFVRGTYQTRIRFVDDEGKTHFDATYYFEIQKN